MGSVSKNEELPNKLQRAGLLILSFAHLRLLKLAGHQVAALKPSFALVAALILSFAQLLLACPLLAPARHLIAALIPSFAHLLLACPLLAPAGHLVAALKADAPVQEPCPAPAMA
eukprot:1159122-Pelagomonas_calceolata.AAC.8